MSSDNEPDHLYLDLIICNNDNGSSSSQILTFSESRDTPILQNCADWYLYINRFTITTPNLPLMIIPVLTGQPDINKSSLSITLKYGDNEVQKYIDYVPQNANATIPAPPIIKQDFGGQYYEIYSYQYFIKLLNKAISDATDELKAIATLPSINPCYFEFDPNTEKAILNADILGYNNTLSNPIELYMNTTLFQWFNSFDATFYGTTGITNGKNYKINIYELPNSGNVYSVGSAGSITINYLQEYQEFATLGAMSNPISSILFTSNTIPISATLSAKPVIFNANPSVSDQTGNSTIINMLTDIMVGTDLGFEYKPNIIYNANPYRLIPLQSNQPLRSYDISLFWRDIYGNIKPFSLSPSSRSTMKIGFVKKDSGKL